MAILITRTGPDQTKDRFFENTIKHKKLIYCAAHLVATLPIMVGLAATAARVSDGMSLQEKHGTINWKQSNYRLKFFLMA